MRASMERGMPVALRSADGASWRKARSATLAVSHLHGTQHWNGRPTRWMCVETRIGIAPYRIASYGRGDVGMSPRRQSAKRERIRVCPGSYCPWHAPPVISFRLAVHAGQAGSACQRRTLRASARRRRRQLAKGHRRRVFDRLIRARVEAVAVDDEEVVEQVAAPALLRARPLAHERPAQVVAHVLSTRPHLGVGSAAKEDVELSWHVGTGSNLRCS